MKRMAVTLAAMGISTAAFASSMDPIPDAQSYASPNSDVYVVREYIIVPSDTVLLVPLDPSQDEGESPAHVPG